MKKSTLINLVAYLNGETVDLDTLRTEVMEEYERTTAKARANADRYAMAKDIILAEVTTEPKTVKEIYTACQNVLPEGFTQNKVQYALLNYWNDEVDSIENGKNPKTYVKKS